MYALIQAGQPAQAAAEDALGHVVHVEGPVPEEARNVPLTREKVEAQLSRTGGTPFGCEKATAKVAEGLSLPLSALNDLRRRALEELIVEGYPTNAPLAHLIMHDPEFVRGRYDTGFLEQNLDRLLELGGERSAALGGDWDGCDTIADLPAIDSLPRLYEHLLHHGYRETVVQDLFYNNLMRVVR